MVYVDPSFTVPVSVTGGTCALKCPHCGGHYLKHMARVEDIPTYALRGFKSFLISGGMSPDGGIPFEAFKETLKGYKEEYGLLYNFHVGFKKSRVAKELADVVSMDFFGDPSVVKSIYGMEKTPDELIEIANYYGKVVFHVTVGIMGGRITHEEKALEILSTHTDTVVLNVFVPTRNTPFEACPTPNLDEVVRIFEKAREKFKKVILGCMQPGGGYRELLQKSIREYVDVVTKPVGGEGQFKGCCAFIALG